MVKKWDRGFRFCIDFHELSKLTLHDQFSLPCTDDLVDTLANNRVYSSLNLRSRYWQVHIAEESIECTTFVTELRQ